MKNQVYGTDGAFSKPAKWQKSYPLSTAREWDSESQTYYYRARYDNPSIGRFLSADPIGYWGGLNLYSYVRNNAVNLTDSLGMRATCIRTPKPRFDPETGEELVPEEPSPVCCLLKFEVKRNRRGSPSGWHWATGSVAFWFEVYAEFTNVPPPCKCYCCEYRQEIKGFYMWGGKIQKHELLPGKYIKPNDFQEDGTPQGVRYGHKADGAKCGGWYLSGDCIYWTHDEPGIINEPYPMMFDLAFKGTIVDICQGERIVSQKEWRIAAYAQDSPESGIDYDEGVD